METVEFKLGVSIASLASGLEAAERKLDVFGRNAKKALELGAGAFVGKEILTGIDAVIEKGKEWESSNNRIIGLLRATGNAAGITKGEIEEMAETLSRTALADDDAIKDVAATLLKFGNIQEDVFKRAVKSS